nr:MAG TPA: hypothetical protein [Bacteriophage sp.]
MIYFSYINFSLSLFFSFQYRTHSWEQVLHEFITHYYHLQSRDIGTISYKIEDMIEVVFFSYPLGDNIQSKF